MWTANAFVVGNDTYEEEESLSPVLYVLHTVRRLIRTKLRASTLLKTVGQNDGMGVLLYNTAPKPHHQKQQNHATRSKLGDDEPNNNDDEDEDDNDDDEEEDRLYGATPAKSTTVHEFLPLVPPGVATVQTLSNALPTAWSGVAAVDLQREYAVRHDNALSPATKTASATTNDYYNDDDNNDNAVSTSTSSLLEALTRAYTCFATAPCVRKDKKRTPNNNKSAAAVVEDVKQIWIVTAHDMPHTGIDSEETLRLIREKCHDLKEANIDVFIWPLLVPRDDRDTSDDDTLLFDARKFYDSIARVPLEGAKATTVVHRRPNDSTDDDDEDPADAWIRYMQSSYKTTRPAFRVPLLLPGWQDRPTTPIIDGGDQNVKEPQQQQQESVNTNVACSIHLDFYNLQQTAKEPATVIIHQETGKALGKMSQILALDGSCQILAEKRMFESQQQQQQRNSSSSFDSHRRLRTYVEFGNNLVPLTYSDKVAIKKQCNANSEFASLILLGFKPEVSVPFYHSVEKSYFCYPSDSVSASSTDAFAHLHQSMINKNVVAIGELLTRVSATSRLVVLRPLPEQLSGDLGHQSHPPGLLVTSLPFDDEMRAIEPDLATKEREESGPIDLVSDELVEAAKNLIQKQTLVGVEIGEMFQNAAMCRFWNYIEHIALGEGLRVDGKFDTDIDVDQIQKLVGTQISQFLELLPDDIAPEKPKRGQKRKEMGPDDSDVDWEKVIQDGTIEKCKVAELKTKLKSIGESTTGNKSAVRTRPHERP